MNGAADMGGMDGFGPVVRESNEPVLPRRLGGRVVRAQYGHRRRQSFGISTPSASSEKSIPPPEYLNLSYYGLWTRTLELMMLEYGVATPEELASGHTLAPVKKAPHAVTAAEVANMVRCGSPYDRPAPASALFKVGDKVRAKNMHPKTHTRLPRYARGHLGQVVRIVGCHVFPGQPTPAISARIHIGSTR